MSYKKELRKQIKVKNDQLQAIFKGRGVNEISPNARMRVKQLSDEIRDLETNYGRVREQESGQDYRGSTGNGRKAQNRAFENYLRNGDTQGLRMVPNIMETRADGVGISTNPMDAGAVPGPQGNYGGYMVSPDFWAHLSVALKAYGGIAGDFAQIDTPTGALLPYPVIDPTAVTASLVGSELTQLSVSSPYIFGQGMLAAWPYAVGPVLASLQLVNDSAFAVDDFVATRFGEALGRSIAAAAVSGTGSGQPEGIVTALDARGSAGTAGGTISAIGGYVTLAAATKVPVFSSFSTPSVTELVGNLLAPSTLINMLQAIDPLYYPGCKWYFNATQAWNMRTITDGNGRPILNFMNGFTADDVSNPNYSSGSAVATLFGFPVIIDNSIPNLTASTTGGPVLGALKNAMVMRTVSGTTSCMRLQERYADYLAIGYLGWARLDIRSNDLRAAVTVQPATT